MNLFVALCTLVTLCFIRANELEEYVVEDHHLEMDMDLSRDLELEEYAGEAQILEMDMDLASDWALEYDREEDQDGELREDSKKPQCKPKKKCKKADGICQLRSKPCGGTIIKKGCKGNNCICCKEPPYCEDKQGLGGQCLPPRNLVHQTCDFIWDTKEPTKYHSDICYGQDEYCCVDCYAKIQKDKCENITGYNKQHPRRECCPGDLALKRMDSGCNCCGKCTPTSQCTFEGGICVTRTDPVYGRDYCNKHGGSINTKLCEGENCDCCIIPICSDLSIRCSQINGFMTPSQDQCFRWFGEGSTWEEAASKCQRENLQLASPKDVNAVWTRKHIIDNFPDGTRYHTWIGGRGDGPNIIWVDNNKILSDTNSLWLPNEPSNKGADYGLLLATERYWMNAYPEQTYLVLPVERRGYRILCELPTTSTTAGQVFIADIENSLSYALRNTILFFKTYKFIFEKPTLRSFNPNIVKTLKDFFRIAEKYLSSPKHIQSHTSGFIKGIYENIKNKETFTSKYFLDMLIDFQNNQTKYFISPNFTKSVGCCKNSSGHFWQYTCGLWNIMHTLTHEAKAKGAESPMEVIDVIYNFVIHFQGCHGCENHFKEGYYQTLALYTAEEIKKFNHTDAILWLWCTHNAVNHRYSVTYGGESGNAWPPHPQFPHPSDCPNCWSDSATPTKGTTNCKRLFCKHTYAFLKGTCFQTPDDDSNMVYHNFNKDNVLNYLETIYGVQYSLDGTKHMSHEPLTLEDFYNY